MSRLKRNMSRFCGQGTAVSPVRWFVPPSLHRTSNPHGTTRNHGRNKQYIGERLAYKLSPRAACPVFSWSSYIYPQKRLCVLATKRPKFKTRPKACLPTFVCGLVDLVFTLLTPRAYVISLVPLSALSSIFPWASPKPLPNSSLYSMLAASFRYADMWAIFRCNSWS